MAHLAPQKHCSRLGENETTEGIKAIMLDCFDRRSGNGVISRGDVIAKPQNQPEVGQDIEAMICWFSRNKALEQHGKYILRHTTREVMAVIKEVRYKVNINTLHKIEDDLSFKLNDIGRICLRTSSPLMYDSYERNRTTGSFVLIDEFTNETVAAGMIK